MSMCKPIADKFLSAYCFSLDISIFQPVILAASLAFWPSLPMARES